MWLRFLALRAVRSLGYEVRRVQSPAELSLGSSKADPITLEYCPSRRGFAVFDVPVVDCRAFHSLGLRLRREEHPFVMSFDLALRDSVSRELRQVIQNVLEDYYLLVRPTTALEVVDLSCDEAPGLSGISPMGYLFPWEERGVDEVLEGRRRSLRYVAMRYGIKAGAEAGHTLFGPVSKAKLSLQVRRLGQLLDSVRRRGFQPFARDFPTRVIALLRNGEYRWLIDEGQHRFALAGAFDVPSVPAMLTAVVRREDARFWPQVVSGIFTEIGALKLFDRLFDGVPPTICDPWINRPR